MTDTIVIFLADDGEVGRWLRIVDEAIVARAEGLPPMAIDDDLRWVAIAPASAVTLHWAALPDGSLAQAAAAARLLVAEASATALAQLHVAVGDEGHPERPIAVVTIAAMERWLGALAAAGIDPQAMIPAPLLLPRPEHGYLVADLGGEQVARGGSAAFADEPGLTELIVGDEPFERVGGDAIAAMVVSAVAAPPLDLRQGLFARRRRRAVDWRLARRLGWLVVALLTVTLLISLVTIVRYDRAAAAAETQADTLARSGLAPGEPINDAQRQLATRLTALRGAGAGFSRTAAAVFSAVRAVPGTTITSLDFDSSGVLKVSLAAAGEGQASEVLRRVRGYGFTVTPGAFTTGEAGKANGDMTVTAR